MKTHLPLLLAFATLAVPLSAHAVEYTVTSTADGVVTANGDTSGTLRQVLTNANLSTVPDTIIFAPGVSGRIALTTASGGPLVTGNSTSTSGSLSITGPIGGISISGSNAVRVIQNTGSAPLTLENLTIRDGLTAGNGAGISNNSGDLTIRSCTLANNNTTNPSGTGGGGAVANGSGTATGGGTLTIINSTLSNNSASRRGGAVFSFTVGSTLLQNCTLTGNFVKTSSTANPPSPAFGGAIYNGKGTTNIESCTIAGNSADLATGNGAGVATVNTGAITNVKNSIIADNRTIGGGANSSTDVDVVGGANTAAFVSGGNNAIGTGTAVTSFAVATDQTAVTAATIKLGALANNGGPTQTLALLPGSVAINTGATGLGTDQRGAQRDATPDIGAFEFVNTPPTLEKGVFSASVNQAFAYPIVGKDANAGDTLTYAKTGTDVLPGNVTVASDGTVSGTPTSVGVFNFNVTVTDSQGATATARFSLTVVNRTDGVAPRLKHDAIPSPLTRDQLAAITFAGTVRDLAPTDVTESGVRRVQIQLRNSAGQAYNGTAFTPNLSPYYGTNLDPGGVAAERGYSRSLSFVPSSTVLTPGDYTFALYGLDNAGNYGGLLIPFTIIDPAPANGGPTPAGASSAPSALRVAPQASTSGGRS